MSKKSSAFDQMKYEVANEMGVQLNHGYNGDKTAREKVLSAVELLRRFLSNIPERPITRKIPNNETSASLSQDCEADAVFT